MIKSISLIGCSKSSENFQPIRVSHFRVAVPKFAYNIGYWFRNGGILNLGLLNSLSDQQWLTCPVTSFTFTIQFQPLFEQVAVGRGVAWRGEHFYPQGWEGRHDILETDDFQCNFQEFLSNCLWKKLNFLGFFRNLFKKIQD